MQRVQNTQVIAASQLRCGQRLWHPQVAAGMRVERIRACCDGSLRIVTDLAEHRMTPSVYLRVLN